jgi:hypothetical protein
VELRLTGTHHLLVCADDVNILADNMTNIEKNIEDLLAASNEVVLKLKGKKVKLSLCLTR